MPTPLPISISILTHCLDGAFIWLRECLDAPECDIILFYLYNGHKLIYIYPGPVPSGEKRGGEIVHSRSLATYSGFYNFIHVFHILRMKTVAFWVLGGYILCKEAISVVIFTQGSCWRVCLLYMNNFIFELFDEWCVHYNLCAFCSVPTNRCMLYHISWFSVRSLDV